MLMQCMKNQTPSEVKWAWYDIVWFNIPLNTF